MNLRKFVRVALKTGLYLLEQSDKATAGVRNRVKEEIEDLADRTREVVGASGDHTLRNAISLAAGVGLGVAVGILCAPASGQETRSAISEKVQDAGARVRERFSPQAERATGT